MEDLFSCSVTGELFLIIYQGVFFMAQKPLKPKRSKNDNPPPSSFGPGGSADSVRAVAVLIFYPPFFRGLFKESMFVTHIVPGSSLRSMGEKIYRQDYRFLHTPLDWAIFAYAGAYLLALIGAVHPGMPCMASCVY